MAARSWRWLSVVVFGLAGFLLIAYVVLKLAPDWFAETNGLDAKGRADARQGVRTASLALLAGTVGVVGAVYTARSFALSRAGQLTDRFTKAIEQLGHAELDVRLGGIYALERIARDSKEDNPQVIEVLTAYVREHAPTNGAGRVEESQGTNPKKPATDVQAALTVLGRRTVAHEHDTQPALDLGSTDLRGADLSTANLQRAILTKANLTEANLKGADLRSALVDSANLSGADLGGADLQGAWLSEANLSGANLSTANLQAANLYRANLSRAYVHKADLREASLHEAELAEAELHDADLRLALVDGANLSGSNLSGADLRDAGYGHKTIWPEGFDPGASGARATSE